MFGRLFRGGGSDAPQFEPRMPEVDVPADIEAVFAQARAAAAGDGEQPPNAVGRHVVIVTPGRMLMFQPCPRAGSMPAGQVAAIEKMISPAVKRKIAAIAYTELQAVRADAGRSIPFLGILLGFAYIGHAVWVFEGDAAALVAGCRDADILIVDGGMLPHLPPNWQSIAAGAMRRPEIYLHDRATYALRKAQKA